MSNFFVPALVEVRGIRLSVDQLVLQQPTLARAQLSGDVVVEPVDLDQIDLVVGLVLGDVTQRLTCIGIADELAGVGVPLGALAAEEPVDEPRCEVREQHRRLLARRHLPLSGKECRHVLRFGLTWLRPLGRWKVTTVIGPVGERRPGCIGRHRAQRVWPSRDLQDRPIDEDPVDPAVNDRHALNKLPQAAQVRRRVRLDPVGDAVADVLECAHCAPSRPGFRRCADPKPGERTSSS